MNKKIWDLLTFTAAVGISFLFWVLFLGGCCIDGFLDLDMVEIGDIWVKWDFVMLCLFPPIMMGYVVVSVTEDELRRRRMKNGNKNED